MVATVRLDLPSQSGDVVAEMVNDAGRDVVGWGGNENLVSLSHLPSGEFVEGISVQVCFAVGVERLRHHHRGSLIGQSEVSQIQVLVGVLNGFVEVLAV